MIEQQITVTVSTASVETLSDVVDLIEWSLSQEGIAVTVSAQIDKKIVIQLDGVTVDTAYAELGDTITFDGTRFTVTKPETNNA